MELEQFLRAGSPPVVFAFGSHVETMGGRDRLIALACDLATIAGVRVVVAGILGPKKEKPRSDAVMVVPFVDLDELLSRSYVVVCHAGIGTLGSALRCGVPAIMFPRVFDQPYSAGLVERRGAGVTLNPSTEFNASAIHKALQRIDDEAFPNTLARLSGEVRAENGIRFAVDCIEGLLDDAVD